MLFNAVLAARLRDLDAPALAAAPRPEPAPVKASREETALQLLALFQREGRLVDFLEQDIASFSDADVGAAARVVHEGCRRAVRSHMTIAAIRNEEEGAKVTVPSGFAHAEVKLTGNVQGSAPFTGTLRHKGWRARDVHLPSMIEGHDANVLAPAEIEL